MLHKGHDNNQGAGTPLLWGKGESVGLFSLEKRSLWGDLTAALKGAYKKDGDLSAGPVASGQRVKFLNWRRVSLGQIQGKSFFKAMVVNHWNGLPREMIDVPFPETLKGFWAIWSYWRYSFSVQEGWIGFFPMLHKSRIVTQVECLRELFLSKLFF